MAVGAETIYDEAFGMKNVVGIWEWLVSNEREICLCHINATGFKSRMSVCVMRILYMFRDKACRGTKAIIHLIGMVHLHCEKTGCPNSESWFGETHFRWGDACRLLFPLLLIMRFDKSVEPRFFLPAYMVPTSEELESERFLWKGCWRYSGVWCFMGAHTSGEEPLPEPLTQTSYLEGSGVLTRFGKSVQVCTHHRPPNSKQWIAYSGLSGSTANAVWNSLFSMELWSPSSADDVILTGDERLAI